MDEKTTATIDQMNAHLEQFKQMANRARSRIERLAELSMEVEGELKQKELAERVSELFDISNQFETKLEDLISDYEIERNRIASEGE